MKIYVLIENHSGADGLICEHGLSLFIEYNQLKILLDAGTTQSYLCNATQMGINLSDVDIAVLSHGHYDHSGGFISFFEENATAPLYLNVNSLNSFFSNHGELHPIGIPKDVLSYEHRFIKVHEFTQIAEDIFLVPHTTSGLDIVGKKAQLYKLINEKLIPDDFSHEQSLVFNTDEGLIIFNSCSHGGLPVIVNEVLSSLKSVGIQKPVFAYIGGLHMKGKCNGAEICTFNSAELDEVCTFISKNNIQHIYTGHCTGDPGFVQLQKRLPNKFHQIYTGMSIFLEGDSYENSK